MWLIIIEKRKTFYWQRMAVSSYSRKETVHIDIIVTSRNGGRKCKSCNLSE